MTRDDGRRTARRIALTVQAWLGLIACDLALLAGFARVHDWLKRHRHT